MHIQRRMEVDCSPAILWRCLTEEALLKQWISQLVEEILDDPKMGGLGARSTIRLREGPKVVDYRSVVMGWEPERRLAIRLSGGSFAKGMEMDVVYELTHDLGDKTILEYEASLPLKGIFKLMGPVIWLASLNNSRKDLSKLKQVATSMKL